jgi:2-polyprenyl-3-methyl-5-hydroxy-6-metoxy-1,4-benzoquinol methylase
MRTPFCRSPGRTLAPASVDDHKERPIPTILPAPAFDDLDAAVRGARAYLKSAAAARANGWVNTDGGDVAHGTGMSVVRHVANYLGAVSLASSVGLPGAMVDVGAGVGALGAWAAERLGLRLHLVDRDPGVRAVAARAFPEVTVHADLNDLEAGCAALVCGMEVVEHVAPVEQLGFVQALWRLVAPGGLLVVSTPDETGYLGGWSGYAPHIGCLDAPGLRTLLQIATGTEPLVWRLEGAPFALGPVARVVQPLANRAWARLEAPLGAAAARLAAPAAALAARLTTAADAPAPRVVALPPDAGTGTGLLAAVRRPSAAASTPPPGLH